MPCRRVTCPLEWEIEHLHEEHRHLCAGHGVSGTVTSRRASRGDPAPHQLLDPRREGTAARYIDEARSGARWGGEARPFQGLEEEYRHLLAGCGGPGTIGAAA